MYTHKHLTNKTSQKSTYSYYNFSIPLYFFLSHSISLQFEIHQIGFLTEILNNAALYNSSNGISPIPPPHFHFNLLQYDLVFCERHIYFRNTFIENILITFCHILWKKYINYLVTSVGYTHTHTHKYMCN